MKNLLKILLLVLKVYLLQFLESLTKTSRKYVSQSVMILCTYIGVTMHSIY